MMTAKCTRCSEVKRISDVCMFCNQVEAVCSCESQDGGGITHHVQFASSPVRRSSP